MSALPVILGVTAFMSFNDLFQLLLNFCLKISPIHQLLEPSCLFVKVVLAALCSTVLLNSVRASTVLIADYGMSRMIELTTRAPYCHVHTDRGNIRNMLLAADQRRVRQMSDDSISKLEEVCRSKQVLSAHQGGFIYPGTKWCGPGDKARNYSDLGYHRKEDVCCREHDNCPNFLAKGECREGICNNSPYTRSHCDCDAAFRRCLQNVNTETANTIGAIFFNVVQVICFKERSPCSQWQKNGYTKAESDKICAQWNFMPSEKYVPLMPLSSS
ncbi:phospholipase A2 isoform X2 [Cylas formicarius]|uniref:phospholipase A2 isoform X2 n=1 Tax=Cylas formicarius TaxID=197179 RepID=UPI0029586424|nr:phospholipase A2 isoform X2 [Cylas formicarius]